MRSWPKAGWCGWGWVSKRCIGSGVKSKVAGFLPPLQSRSSWSPTLARLSPAPPLGDPSLAIWLRSKFWSACKAQPDGFLWPQALCVTPMFSEWMSGAPHWPCGSLPVHNDMDIFQENFPCWMNYQLHCVQPSQSWSLVLLKAVEMMEAKHTIYYERFVFCTNISLKKITTDEACDTSLLGL